MNKELKKAILDFMFANSNEFQLVNTTTKEFRQYIFTEGGSWAFGGEQVSEFISLSEKLVKF